MAVTIYLRYVLNTSKLKEFEHYGKLWIPLVEKFGWNRGDISFAYALAFLAGMPAMLKFTSVPGLTMAIGPRIY